MLPLLSNLFLMVFYFLFIYTILLLSLRAYSVMFVNSTGGKCSQLAELSGENINITYKPDGTHVAVGNRVKKFRSSSYVLCSFLSNFKL